MSTLEMGDEYFSLDSYARIKWSLLGAVVDADGEEIAALVLMNDDDAARVGSVV